MFPFLLNHPPLILHTFSFMLMVASLSATFYAYYRAPKKGLSQTVVLDLGIIGTLAGIVGSRLFHVLVEAPGYYWEHPSHIYQIWRGGFVSYGAVILIGLSFAVYLKSRKLNILKYLDLYALGFPLVVFFVRIGCLGAGCCYGKPTDSFFHLIFTHPSSDAGQHFKGVPLHPTQIYDMMNALFLFFVLFWIDQRKKFDGQIVWTFLIGYGLIRGFIEFYRGDAERGLYLNGLISTAQVMGIIGVLLGSFLYLYCKKLGEREKAKK